MQLVTLELELDRDTYYQISESDECSKADVQLFQSSTASSSSFPPLAATYRRSNTHTNPQSRGGEADQTRHVEAVARLNTRLGQISAWPEGQIVASARDPITGRS